MLLSILLMLLLAFDKGSARRTKIRAHRPLQVSGLKSAVFGLFLQQLNLLELNLLVFNTFPKLIFIQKGPLSFTVFYDINAVLI